MAMLTINYGQCGNQVAHDFFTLLAKDMAINENNGNYCDEVADRWFSKNSDHDKWFSRALLVDTEQKVVNTIYRKQRSESDASWRYKRKNVITLQGGGSGNNWSFGYGQKGLDIEEQVLDSFRKEAENCDQVLSILNFLSSAGGTGSGVGSYIMEKLRDYYPTKTVISAIVLPFRTGEVVTQNYNTVLTLAKLYDVTDMTIVFENDHLFKMTSSLLGVTDINLSNLNDIIATKMAAIFQPVQNSSNHITELVSHLISHPAYKLVTIKTSPHIPQKNILYESVFKWNTLVKHINQTLRVSSIGCETDFDWEIIQMKRLNASPHTNSLSRYAQCVANAIITRGNRSNDIKDDLCLLNNASLYPKWLPEMSRVYHGHQSSTLMGIDKFIALATNNHLIHYHLNDITERAWKTYKYKAHLHHYFKYGICEADFYEAFSKMESVIKSYREL